MRLKLFCDGGSRGNPGPAAYGYVIYDVTNVKAGLSAEAGAKAGKILEKCGNYLGLTTNNQAEYQGLVNGLKFIISNYPYSSVQIVMDSLLIVNQVKGLFKVKSPDLLPHYQETMALLGQLSSWSIDHTLRGGNSFADSLVNQALDSHS